MLRNRFHFLPVLFALTLRASLLRAAPVEVSASLDRSQIHIGERVRLTVRVVAPEGTTVAIPPFGEELGGMEVCASGGKPPAAREGGKIVVEAWCLLTAYELKEFKIPPLEIKYKTPDGKEGTAETKELKVSVVSVVKEEMKDIRDIQAPIVIPARRGKFYLLMSLIAAAILLAVLLLLMRRKRRVEEPVTPPRPPHEIALEELEKLKRSGLIESGRIKEFYFRLTDIARHYIEARFGMDAPERTTEEFLLMMSRARQLNDRHKELIADFLRHCDMVKYAKYNPARGEIYGAIDSVEKLIDETKVVSSVAD